MKRLVILDTETTGFNPKSGDRIIEVGLVEVIDNVKTGRVFHKVIDPERSIPEEATSVHGIRDEDVKGKPKFASIANEMIEFVNGAEIIIHNAPFDLKFLNEELVKAGKNKFLSYVSNVRCSLELSKLVFPKIKKTKTETEEEKALRSLGYSLDDLCDRLNVDRSSRVNHGALLDADLLAEVFLKLNELYPIGEIEEQIEQNNWIRPDFETYENMGSLLKRASISNQALEEHAKSIETLETTSKKVPLFKKNSTGLKM